MKIVLTAFLLFLLNGALQGKSLVYLETTGSRIVTNRMNIEETADGFLIAETNSIGVIHQFRLDKNYECWNWRFIHPDKGTDFILRRNGFSVKITGIAGGQKIDREIRLDPLPFYENWSMGMRSMVMRGKTSSRFLSINPYDISMIGHIIAERLGAEVLSNQNKVVESTHIKLTIEGIPDFLYHADYWVRTADGTELRFITPAEFGQKLTRELISEE